MNYLKSNAILIFLFLLQRKMKRKQRPSKKDYPESQYLLPLWIAPSYGFSIHLVRAVLLVQAFALGKGYDKFLVAPSIAHAYLLLLADHCQLP